jgi:hypothetical protein
MESPISPEANAAKRNVRKIFFIRPSKIVIPNHFRPRSDLIGTRPGGEGPQGVVLSCGLVFYPLLRIMVD